MKKLFLLDAYALIFRAHYAFVKRPITTSKGFDTSAVFGFIKSLREVLYKEQPSHIAAVFDPAGGSFRRRIYPEYKANRMETPEAIIAAVPVIKEFLLAYRIPVVEIEDFEADDVIGTMAKRAEQEGFSVFMMTPDKDYGQLVSDRIFIYKPKRSGNEAELLGKEEVCRQYGISSPEQVIDILALWGDAVDNVPGAPGVGEKTAIKLVGEYGGVDELYKHLNELKGKLFESLLNNEDAVRLSRKLVTIVTDVPCEWNEDSMARQEPDSDRLDVLCNEYEFFSMIGKKTSTVKPAAEVYRQTSLFDKNAEPVAESNSRQTVESVEHIYCAVESDDDLNTLVARLESSSEFCFDTETTGLDPFDCRLVGLSFAFRPHEAFYVPAFPNNPQRTAELLNRFKPVFENPAVAKIGQNLKFDIEVLKAHGIEVNGDFYDSMLIHYLLHPDSRHNMDYLAEVYLDYAPVPIEKLIGGKGAQQRTMDTVPIDRITEYAAEDADITLQLKIKLFETLEQENLQRLYSKIEAPLITVLANMEAAGVKIDKNSLNDLNVQYTAELTALESEIRTMTDAPQLNISSPKQLGIVLFEKLKIAGSKIKTTKTKQYSTDEETLVSLKDRHPVVEKILEYRSLKKLLSSYIESLPALVNRRTDKIHTSFNQAVTTTGRLSSNNPNLQNIPVRGDRGREIRKAFVPSDENHVLLSADYSQIELRLMAHLSEDRAMIEAFNHDEDIHTATAAKIYRVPLGDVSRDQRSKAKTANFGIIYGISSFGLAQRLNIQRTEAKQLIDGYFDSYPKVKEYMDKVIADAQKTGYVETLFGRRRQLRDINSGNATMRGMAERYAINAPVQGTAADIIKLAMINLDKTLKQQRLQTKMILQVHDELVFDVFKPELDEIKRIVVDAMQNATKLSVPLIVECGVGLNWLEAH